jgi:hypothetical protein
VLPDLGHGLSDFDATLSQALMQLDKDVQQGGPDNKTGSGKSVMGTIVDICSPGAYRTTCIEFDVHNLAVNTVLEADSILAAEGVEFGVDVVQTTDLAGMVQGQGNSNDGDGNNAMKGNDNHLNAVHVHSGSMSTELSDSSCVRNTFKVLQSLVKDWYHDVVRNDNEHADSLLMHFYRWLCSSAAMLHDPALLQMVQKLMKKVFLQLIQTFKRLGCKIVHATFHRIIIATEKETLSEAQAFAEYVSNAVKAQPLYQYMTLQPKQYWAQMVFLDTANYGGVLLHRINDNETQVEANLEAMSQSIAAGAGNARALQDRSVGDSYHDELHRQMDAFEDEYGTVDDEDDDGNLRDFVVDDEEVEREKRALQRRQERKRKERQIRRKQREKRERRKKKRLKQKEGVDGKEISGDEEEEVDVSSDYEGSDIDEEMDDASLSKDAEITDTTPAMVLAEKIAAARREREEQIAREMQRFEGVMPQHGRVEIVSHWNLADYLPKAVQELFLVIVGEFIYKPLKYRDDRLRAAKRKDLLLKFAAINSAAAAAKSDSSEQTTEAEAETEVAMIARTVAEQMHDIVDQTMTSESEEEYLKQLVSNYFTSKLLRSVPDIMKMFYGAKEFPVLAGSHLDLKNPALEFVKAVCHILQLDKTVKDETQFLRRNLMRLIHIREFGPQAQFRDPCLSFILPDIICSRCNYCRDLDLCRDPELRDSKTDGWQVKCPECLQPYSKIRIEQQLVRIVEEQSAAYQLQDVQCKKTSEIKVDCMSTYSPASGDWQCLITPEQFTTELQTFANIAKFHGFEWLQETVARLMQ